MQFKTRTLLQVWTKVIHHFLVHLALLPIIFVVLVFDIITLPIYLCLQKPWTKWKAIYRPRSKIISKTKTSLKVGSIYEAKKHFLFEYKTLDEALEGAIEVHGRDSPCFAYREVISEEVSNEKIDGKKIIKYELSNYRWINYGQFLDSVLRFGHGLQLLGVDKEDIVAIYADTCSNWMICAHGVLKNGSILTTFYSTLDDPGLAHGIKETKTKCIITSKHSVSRLIQFQTLLKTVILLDVKDGDPEFKKIQSKFNSSVNIVTFDRVVQSGDLDYFRLNPVHNKENDVAVIMYTSGTGGVPKGVLITHRNFLRCFQCNLSLVSFFLEDLHRHTYIAYLPMAHILEFGAQTMIILYGGKFGYSSPQTMTDLSPGLKPGIKGDMTLLKPTIMTSVPLVLDRIRKAIYAKLNDKGFFAVRAFELLLEYKDFWVSKGFQTPILDRLFLDRIKTVVGGKLEMMLTGGAAMSADTQKFIRSALNLKVLSQSYGCTETVGGGLYMDHMDYSLAKCGGPMQGTEVKLVDWTEGGYCVSDRPNPRGEIHISSDSLSIGYFQLQTLTNEAFYVENEKRWFKTGDIGELTSNGAFVIVDRKRDFIKLQFGEFISLGKIETKLKTWYMVNNICVIGNPLHKYLVAVVVPNEKELTKLATRLRLPRDKKIIYSNGIVNEIFHRKLIRFARLKGLRRYEVPQVCLLVVDEWTPETGLVTGSFKLKRKHIEQHYQQEIRKAFDHVDTLD